MSFTYSVCIPTYNNYIQLIGCIDSITQCSDMKQTEIIIVDNGSTDVTPRVCEEYKKVLGDCFRFIRLDSNQGFCIAQNIGLKAATGPYLIW